MKGKKGLARYKRFLYTPRVYDPVREDLRQRKAEIKAAHAEEQATAQGPAGALSSEESKHQATVFAAGNIEKKSAKALLFRQRRLLLLGVAATLLICLLHGLGKVEMSQPTTFIMIAALVTFAWLYLRRSKRH